MSFVWKRPEGRLKSYEQCAVEILGVSRARGLDDFAAVLGLMGVLQESDCWCPWNEKDPSSQKYAFDSKSNDGRSVGYLQEQNGKAGEVLDPGDGDNWWGTMESRMSLSMAMNNFLARLQDNYMDAVGNPAQASEFISNVQGPRADLRGAYAKHWDQAWALIKGAAAGVVPPTTTGGDVGFTGDPVWLEEVLREALGDRLVVEDGWADRGTGGTMGNIWGVMIHHTGNSRETVEGIAGGRPDLAGPLAQGLVTPDGKFHLVAVGPCNHAGIGNYPGVTQNTGNQVLIGFECAWPDVAADGSYDPNQKWPDAQIITMRDASAAVVKKLGYDGSHVIGHKEYARVAPNVKWDPGNLDMNWFRGEVNKDLSGFDFPGEHPAVTPPPAPPSPATPPPDYEQLMFDQTSARWEQLGWRTPVEMLSELYFQATGIDNRGKTGMTRGAHDIVDAPKNA